MSEDLKHATPIEYTLEDLDIDMVLELLKNGSPKMVELTRMYSTSSTYGENRYHIVSQKKDGSIQIEQTNVDEKWPSRVVLMEDQLGDMLLMLVRGYVEYQKKLLSQQTDFLNIEGDIPGDLDGHPF